MHGLTAHQKRAERSSTPLLHSTRLNRFIKAKCFKLQSKVSSSYKKFKKFQMLDSNLTYIHKIKENTEKLISGKSLASFKSKELQVKFFPSIKLENLIKSIRPEISRLNNFKFSEHASSQQLKNPGEAKSPTVLAPSLPQTESPTAPTPKIQLNHQQSPATRCCSHRPKHLKSNQNIGIQFDSRDLCGWETDFD